MAVDLIVHPGADSALIAWRSPFIPDCRGFALRRRIRRGPSSAPSPNATGVIADGSVEEIVASWVGFANGGAVAEGERRPTTIWPIQKYIWSDFAVEAGDQVAYRVTPMVGAASAMVEATEQGSAWSDAVTIGPDPAGRTACFFNRGIVASQWLSRLLPKEKPATSLRAAIGDPHSDIRAFLAGALRERLLALLTEAEANGGHVYAALFELDDPELLPLLRALGQRAHVVLGNGAAKKAGEDENAAARDALAGCDVHDRMLAPRALAHNKFLVLCDADRTPRQVWTGSTNWTKTGLCTQANNAVLIADPGLAQAYLDQWSALAAAGDRTPETLYQANAAPRSSPTMPATTLWFTPMRNGEDLEQAGRLIAAARHGILFMMFNPGPRGTLLSDIIALASPTSPTFKPDLYIQGVLNQDPSTAKNPVALFNRGKRIDASADVVLPAAIPGPLHYWHEEMVKLPGTFAMVHSKVVVIDPYGTRPVVMTGSHNMGPKASGVNDENLLIIEGDAALASQYAGKIMEIYAQYRWRESVRRQAGKPRWSGLADDDAWQIKGAGDPYDHRRQRELDFWFGVDGTP